MCSHRVPSPPLPFVRSLSRPSPRCTRAAHLARIRVALPTLRVCTHSLMLIRLNAQKPSRGSDEPRLAWLRIAEKITGDHEEGESPRRPGWSRTISLENNRDVRSRVRYEQDGRSTGDRSSDSPRSSSVGSQRYSRITRMTRSASSSPL